MWHRPRMNSIKPLITAPEMLGSAVEHGQEFVERGKHSLRKTSHAALEERLIYPATRETVTRCIFT